MKRFLSPQTLIKLALPMALLVGVVSGVLAQDATQEAGAPMQMPQTDYTVLAGGGAPGNADLLMFFPQNLQVHQGDTVTWTIAGFHNVHFEEGPQPLIVVGDVDGQQVPMGNPAALFPTTENGASFTGGDVNSGVPIGPDASPIFSLVMDAEPGTYTYFCDIHPGMSGSIVVVDEGTEIPDGITAKLMGDAEMGAAVGMAIQQYAGAQEQYAGMQSEGGANVTAGIGNEVTNNVFVPEAVVIQAGQSVTWTMQAESREIHTISWPPTPPGNEFVIQEQEGGPPLVLIGPALTPTVENGATIGADGAFNYVIQPGETFSLTFSDPGVYRYVCNLHIGMQGTVIVQPAA